MTWIVILGLAWQVDGILGSPMSTGATRYFCRICHREIPNAGANCPYCVARLEPRERATPQLLFGLFAALVLLFVVTGFLTREFRQERRARGEAHYLLGESLAAQEDFEHAIGAYIDARLESPENAAYRLGLAMALYKSERHAEAEKYLLELKASDPTHSIVNQTLARIAERDGRWEEAASYLRTAIYGRWPDNPAQYRLQTRFELVELLDHRGEREQVVGELLELSEEAPDDPSVKRRLASMFLQARAPARARALFDELLQADAEDSASLRGRGEAEFALGNYVQARGTFRQAERLLPDDEEVRERRTLTEAIVALDPTVRGLSNRARYIRARNLAEDVRGHVETCLNPMGEDFVGPLLALPEPLAEPLGSARELDPKRLPRRVTDEGIEAEIQLAEDLWQARGSACDEDVEAEEALARTMEALLQ